MNNGETRFIDKIRPNLIDVVEKSFDKAKDIKMANVKERNDIVLKLTKMLRFDLGWSRQRIVDKLPHYLWCTLNGEAFDPITERGVWVPPGTNV